MVDIKSQMPSMANLSNWLSCVQCSLPHSMDTVEEKKAQIILKAIT